MSKLRISKLTIRDFRCFSEATVDLSADIIAIYGRNGVGKTGIFDAIEFALFGAISRLGEPISDIDYISRIGCSGDSHVRIDLESDTEHTWVKTSWDRERLIIDGNRSWSNHRDLLYEVLVDVNHLGPRKEVKAVRDLFHSSLMLSQYSIRDFVEAKDPQDRAKILANLAGVAHIQRSKDKAEQVAILAERESSNNQRNLKDAFEQIEELTKQLAELEGRRKGLDNRLAGARPETDDLLRALSRAKISGNTSIPETETVATFSRAARARCDVRYEELTLRSEHLSVLEAGARRYIEQNAKLKRIRDEEEKFRSDSQSLETKHRKYFEVRRDAADKLSKIESKARELSKSVHQLQVLRDLIQQFVDLNKESSDIESAYRTADEEYKKAVKNFNFITRSYKSELEYRESTKLTVSNAEKELHTLEALQNEHTRYVSVCAELESTASKLTVAEADYEKFDVKAKKIADDIANLTKIVSEAEAATLKAEAEADQQHALLARLRSLITEKDCPLCGAEYESTKALLQAIDQVMGAIPEATHTLMAHFQNLKNRMAELERTAEANLRAKNKAQSNLIELRNNLGRLTAEKSRIEDMSSSFGVEFKESEIILHIDAARKKVQELRKTDYVAAVSFQREDEARKLQESQTKDAKERSATMKSQRDRIRDELEAVSLRIAQLGYEKTEIPTQSDVQNNIEKIKNELTEVEKTRLTAEAAKNSAENMERDSTRHLKEIAERLSEVEKEIGTLHGAIQTFVIQCEDFGIKPIQKEFDKARQDLDNDLKAISEARQVAEQLETVGSLEALKSERATVMESLEIVQRQAKEFDNQVKNFEGAKRKAESWILPLTENLEHVVEKTLRLHQLEIERHFKAMIPSPHLFDQIIMRHAKERLEIGVRYRHQLEDAGEPYFYLSNAQLNILALAIFLSLGAKQRWSNLDSLLLDDPVQHLDDLDAVAFLDTIRAVALGRFGGRRQVILSTCDKNLYGLMKRKFRSLESAGLSFNAISLSERGTEGPTIHYDVHGKNTISSLAG